MKKIFSVMGMLIILIVGAMGTLSATEFKKPIFIGKRAAAMGGSTLFLVDEPTTLEANPANLVYVNKGRFYLPVLDIYFNSALWNSFQTMQSILKGSASDYGTAVTQLKGALLNAGLNNLPPFLTVTYIKPNFSISIKTKTDVVIQAHKMYSVFEAYLSANARQYAQFSAGYAKKFRLGTNAIENLNVGISGGMLYRGELAIQKLDMNGIVVDNQFFLYDADPDFPDSPTVDAIANNISQYLSQSYSPFFNIGLTADIFKFGRAGLTIADVVNSIQPASLNLGFMLKPLYFVPQPLFKLVNASVVLIKQDDVKATIELHNVTGSGFLNKVHLGLELSALHLFKSPLIYMGFGLNYGYPTFGITLRAPFVELSYSNITFEEGSYLGAKPNIVNNLSLSLRC